ncbi:MAG: hypothetical protein NT173_05305 [Opitutales bacterium]|nr:hypothetical protein [Opitutales bacterium]
MLTPAGITDMVTGSISSTTRPFALDEFLDHAEFRGHLESGLISLKFSPWVRFTGSSAIAYSRRYLAEFMRICAPGGAVYFQITARTARPARRSWYPPTVAKKIWRRINGFLLLQPTMEMHSLPRAEVESVIRAAGGEIVSVDSSHGAGTAFESCVYLARRA